jgi:pimeloyl-ACP methyl ester carboxylesterase
VTLAPLEMSLAAADGVVLKGTLTYPGEYAGTAFPLAVLAHQYPATRDSYSPLALDLAGVGVATLAFDQRGHGASIVSPTGPWLIDSPLGVSLEAFGSAFMSSVGKVGFGHIADDILRVTSWGSFQNFVDPQRIALVGASIGGSGVLLAAEKIPTLRAVATLGAAGAPAFGPDTADQIRGILERLKVPCYLASSQDDPFQGGANVTAWSRGLPHVTPRRVPGSAHAMAIYYDVRDELLHFLHRSLDLE